MTCRFGGNCVDGSCVCGQRDDCPDSYEPLCASDGKTVRGRSIRAGEESIDRDRWRERLLCNPPLFQYLNYCHLELDNCALQQYANFRPLKVVESRVCNDAVSQCQDGNCAGCPRYVRVRTLRYSNLALEVHKAGLSLICRPKASEASLG